MCACLALLGQKASNGNVSKSEIRFGLWSHLEGLKRSFKKFDQMRHPEENISRLLSNTNIHLCYYITTKYTYIIFLD